MLGTAFRSDAVSHRRAALGPWSQTVIVQCQCNAQAGRPRPDFEIASSAQRHENEPGPNTPRALIKAPFDRTLTA